MQDVRVLPLGLFVVSLPGFCYWPASATRRIWWWRNSRGLPCTFRFEICDRVPWLVWTAEGPKGAV